MGYEINKYPKGKRVYTDQEFRATPGSFYHSEKFGDWWCHTPDGHMASMANHKIIENENGEITVSPSIVIMGWDKDEEVQIELWRGHIVSGRWIT